MSDSKLIDYYELLGIAQDADGTAVQGAVKSQRKVWVLRQNAASLERRQEAERQLENIAAAERVLLDANQRTAYDLQLRNQVAVNESATATGAQELVRDAQEALERKDASRASWLAREATTRYPQEPAAWHVRAEASSELGQLQDATYEFERARDLDPNDPLRYFMLGLTLENRGLHKEALEQYARAHRMAPDVKPFGLLFGSLLARTGYVAEGLRLLEPLAREHPNDSDVQSMLAGALNAAGLRHWHGTRDGEFYCTSREAAEQSLPLFRRAMSLNFQDDVLRSELASAIGEAEWALKKSWTMSARMTLLLVILSFMVSGIFNDVHEVFGILAFAACSYGIVVLARRPNYTLVAKRVGVN